MPTISENFRAAGAVICVDTETAMAPRAFEGRDCVRLIQVYSPSHEFYYDLKTFSDIQWTELKNCLEDTELTLIFQNAAFDIRVLQGCGIDVKGRIEDTMLQSWLLNNGIPTAKNSLEAIAQRELGIKIDKTLQKSDWMNADLNDAEIEYGMNDVRITYDAFFAMKPRIEKFDLDIVYEIEIKAIKPTIMMEAAGLYFDRAMMDGLAKDLEDTCKTSLEAFVEGLDAELVEYGAEPLPKLADGRINLNKKTTGSVKLGTKVFAGFNPASSQQVLKAFKAIGIEPTDPMTGRPSVDKKFLIDHNDRSVVKDYLDYKNAKKRLEMANTLTKAQAEDGRVYGRFNQTGTFTGRYSSSGPNLQNIPKGDMRHCFVAPEGREIVDLDYSGMELRALCSPRVADEPAMAEAFIEGGDVHRSTASLIFKIPLDEVTDDQKSTAKAINFAAAYGSGARGIVNYFRAREDLENISLAEGEKFLGNWLKAYPKIQRWHNVCRELVNQDEPVVMVDGRRRFLIGEKAKRHTTFCNNLCQGSCASAMKLALYGIHRLMPLVDSTARLVGVIHDEVLIECAEGKGDQILDIAREQMREAGAVIFGPKVPLEAKGSVAKSWGAAH